MRTKVLLASFSVLVLPILRETGTVFCSSAYHRQNTGPSAYQRIVFQAVAECCRLAHRCGVVDSTGSRAAVNLIEVLVMIKLSLLYLAMSYGHDNGCTIVRGPVFVRKRQNLTRTRATNDQPHSFIRALPVPAHMHQQYAKMHPLSNLRSTSPRLLGDQRLKHMCRAETTSI